MMDDRTEVGHTRPRIGPRRVILAVLGGAVVVSGVILAWSFASKELNEFYWIPRDKGDRIFPRRWQDFVMLGVIWTVLLAWFWSGYRLLRLAFRRVGGADVKA
jgi:hypothetical protein